MNPGSLNKYLGENCYTAPGSSTCQPLHSGCGLFWTWAVQAFHLNWDSSKDFKDIGAPAGTSGASWLKTKADAVNSALAAGNLVIINIPNPTQNDPLNRHFLVVYGAALPPNPTDDSYNYEILDPFGASGLLSKYGTWTSLNPQVFVIENRTPQPSKPWAVVAHSPVELMITDPSGAQTGSASAAGQYTLGIPGSLYSEMGTPVETTYSGPPLPSALYFVEDTVSTGTYTVQVIGTGSGPYTLDFQFGFGSVGLVTVTGTAAPNVTDTYIVTIAPDQAPTVQRQSTTPPAVSPPCTPANNCYFNTPVPSPSPSTTTTPTPTASATATPTPTPVVTPTPKPNSGGVAGATSRRHVTPPPTATLDSSTTGQPSSGIWLVLLALAGLLAAALFAIPTVPGRARRHR